MVALKIVLFTTLVQILMHSTNGQRTPFFRKDYTYIEATQSFYKIHTISRTWPEARKRCAYEGASLFYAEEKSESDAVVELWKNTQPSISWLFVGISDLLSEGEFMTVDGKPIDDVYNGWGQNQPDDTGNNEDCVIVRKDGTLNDVICLDKYHFVCKKSLFNLEWNDLCEMPDKSYKYNHDMGRCYKFHLTPTTWNDAYSVCSAEQSYLAIINSNKEADFLVNLTAEAPKDTVSGNYLRGAVHLGFHNRVMDGWQTIRGVKLQESGYSKWGGGQPDGGDRELCGSMFYKGGFNDIICDGKCFFICEHDIPNLNTAIDEKFGVIG